MNRTHCGLHLFGNVLPAARELNRQKARMHYRDFVQDRDRLDRIEEFVRVSDYWDRGSVFGDRQGYCEAQYRAVDALCQVNKWYLENLLPVVLERDEEGETEPPELGANRIHEDVLPFSLNPSPGERFWKALLREKHARMVETHRDGRQVVRRWEAGNMSAASNVIGNLRSRPRCRKRARKQPGIESLTVSTQRP